MLKSIMRFASAAEERMKAGQSRHVRRRQQMLRPELAWLIYSFPVSWLVYTCPRIELQQVNPRIVYQLSPLLLSAEVFFLCSSQSTGPDKVYSIKPANSTRGGS